MDDLCRINNQSWREKYYSDISAVVSLNGEMWEGKLWFERGCLFFQEGMYLSQFSWGHDDESDGVSFVWLEREGHEVKSQLLISFDGPLASLNIKVYIYGCVWIHGSERWMRKESRGDEWLG